MTPTQPPRPMRYEALYGDRVVLCDPDLTRGIWDLLASAYSTVAEREAVICGAKRLTWAEVHQSAEAVSAWLAAQGLEQGDRVGLLLDNDWPYVAALFAIARLGAIAVPISPKVAKAELQYILEDSAAKLLLFTPQLEPVVPASDVVATLDRALPFGAQDVPEAGSRDIPPIALSHKEDIALIVYTSGTTGRPKGSTITHVGVMHSVTNYQNCLGLGHDDRILAAVPLCNITGIVALVMTAARAGAALIILPEFRANKFLEMADREQMTYTLMVPAMFNLCLLQADFAQWDLASWRIGAYGAAPMPSSTISQIAAALPSLHLVNVYGATETTSPSALLPHDQVAIRPSSVGRPVSGCEIAIMDPDGREQAPGDVGEIWIKGPMVARSYWNNPIETDENFVGGYWKSGDLGSLDDEGYLYIHDRQKDMINRGGEKIFSAEVEAILVGHPEIVEAAVVGRSCPVLGERAHAFVVVDSGAPVPKEQELKLFASRALATFKQPESWTILTEPLPRNANGKVLKSKLRDTLAPLSVWRSA